MVNLVLTNPTLPKVRTNKGYILFKLLRGHLIDNKQMKTEIDTCYGAARISELRSDGWKSMINLYIQLMLKIKKCVSKNIS